MRSALMVTLLAAAFSFAGPALAGQVAGAAAEGLGYPVGRGGPVKDNGPPPGPDIARGPDSLQLLSQTPWVGPSSARFQLHLKVTARNPAREMLEVIVYSALTTRSQFQTALSGQVYGFYYQPGGGPIPLSNLTADPHGGVDLDIAVNQASGGLQLGATGVYPVQAFLEQAGVPMGQPLTTFIVYAGRDASPVRLEASVVVPLAANVPISAVGVPGPVPAGAAATIDGDASALGRWKVPVTVQASAPTLESLAKGTEADRDAVTELRAAVSAGDELLPTTALPIDIAQFVNSGLTDDLKRQLSSGGADVEQLLGVAPSLVTWAFADDVDPSSMSALAGLGTKEVAVPESDLSALPIADEKFTFAQPAELSLRGPSIDVVGADSELSQRIAEAAVPGQAVLVADQVVAELAMIDLETPSDRRGVVLIPPAGVAVNPVFLSVLLAGLEGDPLVQAVPLQQVFRDVPLAPSGNGGPMVRQLDSSAPAGAQLDGAGQLPQALTDVAADGEVYGPNASLVTGLSQRLFVSLSSAFDPSQRSAMIAAVLRSADSALGKVTLPPSISITLTSRQGRLPLTLLSAAVSPVHIRLVLSSEQLSFVEANFSDGSCEPANAEKSAEDCLLTLSRPTTVLQVPVVVRTSGAFPLLLQVETPYGTEVLKTTTDTVRSTAISDVGLLLMIGAALFLAVWWARNARHGRRARRLVPRPDDEMGAGEPAPSAAGPDGTSAPGQEVTTAGTTGTGASVAVATGAAVAVPADHVGDPGKHAGRHRVER